MTAAASSGCRLLQQPWAYGQHACVGCGAQSRALIRRPNCSDSVGISGSQRPQRTPVGRSGACTVQPDVHPDGMPQCAVGAWDAIGCHGTSPRDGWAAMGQGGGRGRSHPPRNTARWVCPCCLRAGNEDSWTMQVAAVVTMHEVDGTDTAGAERARLGPVLGLSRAGCGFGPSLLRVLCA